MALRYVFNALSGKFDLVDVQASGSETVEEVQFTYATPSPLVLQQVFSNQVLNRCAILVTTPFNDPSAFLTVGITANTSLVFSPSDVSLGILGNTYDQAALFSFSVPDYLQLIISPGASTQGAGLLLYKLR